MKSKLEQLARRVENLLLTEDDPELRQERAAIVAELDVLALESSLAMGNADVIAQAKVKLKQLRREVPKLNDYDLDELATALDLAVETLDQRQLFIRQQTSTLDSPYFTPIAWFDHWNAHVYTDRTYAQNALDGGNHLTPIGSIDANYTDEPTPREAALRVLRSLGWQWVNGRWKRLDLPDATEGDIDCPKAYAVRMCECGFCIAMRRGPVPVIHIKCEVKTEYGWTGTTSLPVERVELEDDGTYTAVTNYWPRFS